MVKRTNKKTKYNHFINKARELYDILETDKFDAMERMYNDGLTFAKIGFYFDVSAPNVYQIITARRVGRGEQPEK